jgi:hypothetical protein
MVPDEHIIPRRCKVAFLHGVVLWSNINTWSIDTVGPKNFAAKYFVGRARPEEVAWSVHCSMAQNNPNCAGAILLDLSVVPEDIKTRISNIGLTSMESFGAYDEGSPMHPSWPAMHSAASCMSIWLPIVAIVTDAQVEELKKMDLAVAMARTVAGVHYHDDNIAGLIMGQHIIEKELADFLVNTYNADRATVEAKIKSQHFDWKITANRLLNYRDVTGTAGQ